MTHDSRMMLQVAADDPRPIYRQIVAGVRRLIVSGDVGLGAVLPSVRGLAIQLSINPNTVARAYRELVAEGWLDSRAGVGFFVAAPRLHLSQDARYRRLDEAVTRFIGDVIALNLPPDAVLLRVAGELALFSQEKLVERR